jgi:hypothetical protein
MVWICFFEKHGTYDFVHYHCLPDSNYECIWGNFMNCTEFVEKPILLFCPDTFLLKVSTLHPRKTWFFLFLSSKECVMQNIPIILCTVLLNDNDGSGCFSQKFGNIFSYQAVWKYCNWTHTVQQTVFLTSINHPLWLKTHDCVPLLHPSIDEAMAMLAESIVLASILFSYAAGHNKDFSVVHIQQSTSVQSIISW